MKRMKKGGKGGDGWTDGRLTGRRTRELIASLSMRMLSGRRSGNGDGDGCPTVAVAAAAMMPYCLIIRSSIQFTYKNG